MTNEKPMKLSSATKSALQDLDIPLSVDLSELSKSDDPVTWTIAEDAQELYRKLKNKLKELK